jgi:hypothetical protein
VLPAPPVSAHRRRRLSLPPAPSHCPPGPTSPGPACQPLAPCRPPLSQPHLRGVRHPPLSEQLRAAASVSCQSMSPNPAPLSLPHFLLHAASHPGPHPTRPLPPPPPLQKEPTAVLRSLLFPPPLLSSAHGHTSVTRSPPFPASPPHWWLSHRGPHRIPPLPTVRPAYPPPLPYLGPLSPLSSSPVALGASWSHC